MNAPGGRLLKRASCESGGSDNGSDLSEKVHPHKDGYLDQLHRISLHCFTDIDVALGGG
jgi:hypothetical protein